MLKIEIDTSKLRLNEYTVEMEKHIDEALNDLAFFIYELSQRYIKGDEIPKGYGVKYKGAIDIGTLLESGYVDNNKYNEKYIGYTAPHGIYIEYGTSPHFESLTPIIPIYEWVMRNRDKIGVKDATNKIRNVKGYGEVFSDMWDISWGIALSLTNLGMKPKPFFRPAVDMGREEAVKLIKKRLKL